MSRGQESLARRLGTAALLVLFLPLILPVALAVLILFLLHRLALYILIWSLWLPKGKDLLVVYSDSPIWHEYMIKRLLPLVQERAVVLNWSERKEWRRSSFAVHVFRSFCGHREFNPLVILFRPFRRARIFRFWSAFKDWKHGHKEPVERLHEELFTAL